jgi:cardiolipin synthase
LLLIFGGCASSKHEIYNIRPSFHIADPEFARTVGSLLGPSLIPGNACTTLLNGDEIFPSMLAAIHTAKKTINLETYIYWSGTIGREFTDALSQRAKAGVNVHVMIDWFGSGKIDQGYLKAMKDSGVQVFEYHPFHFWDISTYGHVDNRTHRKLMIVDGKVGFTGGVGIADEWRGHADSPEHWRDNHYRVEGPIVAQLQAAFLDNWTKSTGEILVGDNYFPELDSVGKLWGQVFKSSAEGGSESMQVMILLSIDCASTDIRLETAYFVPDGVTRRSLIAACKRGVKVQIIVPGAKIDEKVVRDASRYHWGELLKAGVKIYEYQPTMFHCKQMIVDDRWVSIGSANMDNRSFRLNDEANMNILDPAFAAGQIKVFQNDKSHAREITYKQWKHRPFGERCRELWASILDWEL